MTKNKNLYSLKEELLKVKEDVLALSYLGKLEILEYLVDLGDKLDKLPTPTKSRENQIPGCVSEVYIEVVQENDLIEIRGFSEAKSVKGFVFLCCKNLSGFSAKDFKTALKEFEEFLKESELEKYFSFVRANAFQSILNFIKEKGDKFD